MTDSFPSGAEDIFYVAQFAIFRRLFEPTKVIGYQVPCLTARAFDQHNSLLVSALGELVGRSRATAPGRASKGHGQSGFVIRCCRLIVGSSY